jgi:hypothetical protein
MLAQRGREFSGAKKKEALEVWFDEEIDNMKPVMLAQAKRVVDSDLQREWEAKKTKFLTAAKKAARPATLLGS